MTLDKKSSKNVTSFNKNAKNRIIMRMFLVNGNIKAAFPHY
nr:MAG TPA: hypothetical protein [Caudoviricetes sp.]